MTAIDTKYLAKIAEVSFPSSRLAFRGLADDSWKVHSGATRRLLRDLGVNSEKNDRRSTEFGEWYLSYHRSVLVAPARTSDFDTSEGQTDSDLQILARLQHLGAATGLLDFTWDSLVALWFATEVHGDEPFAGKVIVVNLHETTQFQRFPFPKEQQTLENMFPLAPQPNARQFYWEPAFRDDARERVLRQRSVFVIGSPIGLEVSESRIAMEIDIAAEDKLILRKELETLFGIDEPSLFPDLHGFAMANSHRSAISHLDDAQYFINQGSELYQRSAYPKAIIAYDEAVRLDSTRWITYFLRGNVRAENEDFQDAIRDYDSVLDPLKAGSETNPLFKWYTFMATFNRGNMNYALANYEEACSDYDAAIHTATELHKGTIYYNRANARTKLGKFEAACVDYERAIEANIQFARFNKGNALIALGRFDQARQCFFEERRIFNFTKADNNIATMNDVIARVDGRQNFITVYKKEGLLSGLKPIVVVFENAAERERLESNTGDEWKSHGGYNVYLYGKRRNIGNFGGGIRGGSGLKGDREFFLTVTW